MVQCIYVKEQEKSYVQKNYLTMMRNEMCDNLHYKNEDL